MFYNNKKRRIYKEPAIYPLRAGNEIYTTLKLWLQNTQSKWAAETQKDMIPSPKCEGNQPLEAIGANIRWKGILEKAP